MFVWARTGLPDRKTQVSGWSIQQIKQRKKNMLPIPVVALTRSQGKSQRDCHPVMGLFKSACPLKWSHLVPLLTDSSDFWLSHGLPCRDSSPVAGVLAGSHLPWLRGMVWTMLPQGSSGSGAWAVFLDDIIHLWTVVPV